MVEAVNSIAPIGQENFPKVTSPAASLFTLIMLEHVANPSTREVLEKITDSPSWKHHAKVKPDSSIQSGWLKLENTWLISAWMRPTETFSSQCAHFRTKLEFLDIQKNPLSATWELPPNTKYSTTRMPESVLLTEVTYRPIPVGNFTPAHHLPTLEDYTSKPPAVSHQYLQTQIVEGKVADISSSEKQISIPLVSGGALTIREGSPVKSVEYEESPAIFFIPRGQIEAVYRPLPLYGWENLSGWGSDYGRFLEFGRLELSDWLMKVNVFFAPSPSPSGALPVSLSGNLKSAPQVIVIKPPFFFQITGSHGEILFAGEFNTL
jgi:hypothetical protein